jgi:hypothetical protein
MKHFLRISCVVGSTLALSLAAGCSSKDKSRPVNAPPQSAKGSAKPQPAAAPAGAQAEATGPASMRGELTRGKAQVNAALASLAQLTDASTTDLTAPYKKYSDSVTALQKHAEKMKAEANRMNQSRREYFAAWEETVSDVDNPTIRASAEARRTRLREAQQRLTTKSGAVRDAYQPLMRDMDDVRKFLARDLSKQGVALVGDTAKNAQESGAKLNQSIDALIDELDAVDSGMAVGSAAQN